MRPPHQHGGFAISNTDGLVPAMSSPNEPAPVLDRLGRGRVQETEVFAVSNTHGLVSVSGRFWLTCSIPSAATHTERLPRLLTAQ